MSLAIHLIKEKQQSFEHIHMNIQTTRQKWKFENAPFSSNLLIQHTLICTTSTEATYIHGGTDELFLFGRIWEILTSKQLVFLFKKDRL